MTPTTTSAVRAACDAANPGIEDPCEWPTCSEKCQSHMLTTLLANARAEGAAVEREADINPVTATKVYMFADGIIKDVARVQKELTALNDRAEILRRAADRLRGKNDPT